MAKVYTFHPAAAANKALDGAVAEKIDNGATTLFSFWQQKFDSLNVLRCFFQAVTISSAIDTSLAVVFRLIFRKLSVATGSVVIELNGRFFNTSVNPSDRETGALSDVTLSSTTAVPVAAVADTEFEVILTEPGATFVGKQGDEFLFEVVRDGTAGGDTYPDDIALVRVDVIQQETTSSFWLAGGGSTIHYSLGNVGIGINPPTESLHTSGAVVLGTTVNTTPGTIRWTGADFEGRVGGSWMSLTAGGVGNTLDQAYDQGGAGAGRSINIIKSGTDFPVLLQRDVSNPDYGLQLEDDLRIGVGSGAAPKGFWEYNSASSTMELQTVGEYIINIQTGDVGGGVTSPLYLHTGSGDESGLLEIYTGTGGDDTGAISIYTGNCSDSQSGDISIYSGTSSAGVSGQISMATGNASSEASGGLFFSSGTSDSFTTGAITFTTGAGPGTGLISLTTGASTGAVGGLISLTTGDVTGSNSGKIALETGTGVVTGEVSLTTGRGSSVSGIIDINTGISDTGNSGFVRIRTGPALSTTSGNIELLTGNAAVGTGALSLKTGISGTGSSGIIDLITGDSSDGVTGSVTIGTGDCLGATDLDSGHISLITGAKANNGLRGSIFVRSRYIAQSTDEDMYIVPGGETGGGSLARFPLQVGLSTDSAIVGTVNKVVVHRCAIASELVLQDLNGNYYALWVDAFGRLQIKVVGTIYTTHGGDVSGTVVGTQT